VQVLRKKQQSPVQELAPTEPGEDDEGGGWGKNYTWDEPGEARNQEKARNPLGSRCGKARRGDKQKVSGGRRAYRVQNPQRQRQRGLKGAKEKDLAALTSWPIVIQQKKATKNLEILKTVLIDGPGAQREEGIKR